MILNIFSSAYWTLVYLWRNVYLEPYFVSGIFYILIKFFKYLDELWNLITMETKLNRFLLSQFCRQGLEGEMIYLRPHWRSAVYLGLWIHSLYYQGQNALGNGPTIYLQRTQPLWVRASDDGYFTFSHKSHKSLQIRILGLELIYLFSTLHSYRVNLLPVFYLVSFSRHILGDLQTDLAHFRDDSKRTVKSRFPLLSTFVGRPFLEMSKVM